jgi:hypothetical protein
MQDQKKRLPVMPAMEPLEDQPLTSCLSEVPDVTDALKSPKKKTRPVYRCRGNMLLRALALLAEKDGDEACDRRDERSHDAGIFCSPVECGIEEYEE